MQRVLLAVGMEAFEDAIKREFVDDSDFTFIQRAVVYREAVIPAVNDENPDILVLREGLKGGVSILKLLKNLRMSCNGRIVFIAEEHENNQTGNLVKKVSELGVYDVVWGHEIDIDVLCRHIRRPSTYAELMAKLGISQKEDEDDEFGGEYTLAKVVKKETVAEQEGTHTKKGPISYNNKQDIPVDNQYPVSARRRQQQVIDGELAKPSNNIHLSEPLNPGIQRENTQTSVSVQTQTTAPATQAQPPVTATQKPSTVSQTVPQRPVAPASPALQNKTAVPTNVLTSDDLKEMVAAQEKAEQERKAAAQNQAQKGKQNTSVALPVVASGTLPQLQKRQSVLFVGSRDGVGCTSIAFNTALMLASEGKKVVYVDFREELPSQVIRLNLNQNYGGLEKFLLEFHSNVKHVDQCCLRLTNDKRFEKLPPLDILGFSINYIKVKTKYNWGGILAQTIKELKKEYDYVICDSFAYVDNHAICDSFAYVNAKSFLSLFDAVDKVALVTTQDSFHATTMLWAIQSLIAAGYSLGSRTCLIANRFENIHPMEQDMQRIFNIQTVFRMPTDNKGFLMADSVTMPYLYGPRRAKNRAYFQRIRDWIKR